MSETNDSNPNLTASHGGAIGGPGGIAIGIGGDMHGDINITLPDPARALHQLPSPPTDFVGREEELRTLLAAFDSGQGKVGGGAAVVISALSGQGGVGKTTLALKLAEALKPRYPDAQFYLDLRGTSERPTPPREAMASVIYAHHPTAKLPEDEAQVAVLYRSLLSGQKALVVLDNATDDKQVKPLLPPAGCGLIITSRRLIALPGLRPQTLDVLSEEEAVELLVAIAPRLGHPPVPHPAPHPSTAGDGIAPSPSAQDATAIEIARLCGYLPLALRAAASLLLVTPDLDPTDYAASLRDERTRLERIGAEGVEVSVEASLNLSYAALSADAARVFRALAVFPDTFDAAAEEVVAEDSAHAHLSELARRSLVLYNPETKRYRLHDLTRLFAAKRLSDDEGYAAQKRHAGYYESVLRAANKLYMQGHDSIQHGLGLFELEWRNIQAGQAWAATNATIEDDAARSCSDYPDAGAYLLNLRQHPREQIRWREAALAAARRMKNRGAEGVHLSNLGIAYADLGETRKAIEFYEQALVIDREIGDRRSEGRVLIGLGVAYANLGETRKAIEYHEQALVIDREIGDRRGEGAVLGNLGVAYKNLGETRKAIEFYEQDLIIAREIGDRRGEGTVLNNLGYAYDALGETRKAIEIYEQCLAVLRDIGDHRGEGVVLVNLGIVYKNLGEARKAVEFYEQGLTIAREIGDHRGEGSALGNLGNAYVNLGETRKAIEFYEQQLTIVREISDRRGECNALFNMSLALDKLGERMRAIACAEGALKIFEQIESPHTEMVRRQLAEWRKEGEKK